MTRIVRTAYRYKRPPRTRAKAAATDTGPRIVSAKQPKPRSSGDPPVQRLPGISRGASLTPSCVHSPEETQPMPSGDQGDGSFKVTRKPPPFPNLVALHVRWPGNRLDSSFPLKLTLEVEEHHLSVHLKPRQFKRVLRNFMGQEDDPDPELRLRVRLRYCHVRYELSAVSIIADSKYESLTLEGKFQTRASEKSRSASDRNFGVRFGGKTDLNYAGAAAGVSLGAQLEAVGKHARTLEATTTTTPDIYEVRAVPQGWRVGDLTYGDPTKSPCGYLDGRYFDRLVPGFADTCQAEFWPGQDRGTFTFTVTARDGLRIERMDGRQASSDEQSAAKAVMRDRIAALRLEREYDELPLDQVTCTVVRAVSDESTRDLAPQRSMPTSVRRRKTKAPG